MFSVCSMLKPRQGVESIDQTKYIGNVCLPNDLEVYADSFVIQMTTSSLASSAVSHLSPVTR